MFQLVCVACVSLQIFVFACAWFYSRLEPRVWPQTAALCCVRRVCVSSAPLTPVIVFCCCWWQWQRGETTEGRQLVFHERQWHGRGQRQQRQPGGLRRRWTGVRRGRFVYWGIFWTQACRVRQRAQWVHTGQCLKRGCSLLPILWRHISAQLPWQWMYCKETIWRQWLKSAEKSFVQKPGQLKSF